MDDQTFTKRIDTGRASPIRKPIADEAKIMKLYSKALPDPFSSDYNVSTTDGFDIISPPVNPRVLLKLVTDNSYLQQCIQAMVTNTVGFGYTLQFVGDQSSPDITESSPEAIKEQQFLEELFDDPSPFATYQELLNRYFEDKSIFDNAYMETVKDSSGKVIQLNHLPAVTMRITKIDPEPVMVETKVKRGGKDVTIKSYKHFRRFVQLKSDGYTKIYFKEYGDPRNIDPKTGKVSATLSKEDSATEVIHFAGYNPSSVYGLPKWYSQLPSILGSRQAELTNLDFFENNAIPAMAIMVAGGLLTQDTINLLEGNFRDIKGRGSMNKVAIIEASPNMDAASASGATPTPTIKMEPLYASRQQDATFLDYDASCSQKIMSSFRLPPVYVAGSKDYTYASANKSVEVAETQTFIPERKSFDDVWNRTILKSWGIKYWAYRTNNSRISTPTDIINAIATFTDAGAITPNIAIGILNEILNLDIPESKNLYGNIPSTLLESVLRGAGGEDKTNLIINALKILNTEDIASLEPIKVQTPGNADAIVDPVNDPKDAPKANNQGSRSDLHG